MTMRNVKCYPVTFAIIIYVANWLKQIKWFGRHISQTGSLTSVLFCV